MKHLGWMVMVIVTIIGCAGPRKAEVRPLHAPTGTTEAVSQQLEEGNRLLLKQDWAGARDAYLGTIRADQSLAEAHYNLALVLEKLGEKAEARNIMSLRPTWLPAIRSSGTLPHSESTTASSPWKKSPGWTPIRNKNLPRRWWGSERRGQPGV
ncbi:MAG: hypothetical protein QM771_05065 [Nitrospira sp.]